MNIDTWPEVTLADVAERLDYGYTATASELPSSREFYIGLTSWK